MCFSKKFQKAMFVKANTFCFICPTEVNRGPCEMRLFLVPLPGSDSKLNEVFLGQGYTALTSTLKISIFFFYVILQQTDRYKHTGTGENTTSLAEVIIEISRKHEKHVSYIFVD